MKYLLLLPLLLILGCKDSALPKQQQLRLNFHSEPTSLDPRLVRDIPTMTTGKMLYDGLMRLTRDGPVCSVAKSVEQKGKLYTFELRHSVWTDGTAVTAYDFEFAWKSLLHPNFPAELAYHLFMIKGAMAAKNGEIPIQDVAVWAEGPYKLVVELEHHQPYFLQLIAQPICAPIPHMGGDATNGPFQLVHWEQSSELVVEKNPLYWDADAVQLEEIVITMIEDEHTELNMYENNELDWAGSPNSSIPPEALPTLKERSDLFITPIAGTFCYKFNTAAAPFHNLKMRKAFALAINRKAIVDDVLQAGQIVAKSLIPPCMGEDFASAILESEIGNPTLAQLLFEQALAEEGWTRETMPPISLIFSKSEKSQKTAQVVQQEWSETFGIKINLQSYEWNVFLDHLAKGDYQVGGRGFVSDLLDPKSLLDLYRKRNDENGYGNNDTGWESADFITLLDEAEENVNEREHYLKKAEELLLQEFPIVPLYHSTACYLKKEHVHDVYISELCDLDFKYANLARR